MTKNIRVAGICVLIVIIALFAYFIFFAQPPNHQAIVDNIRVGESDFNLALLPRCVSSIDAVYGKGTFSFTVGNTYHYSSWIFTRYNDVELIIEIWGPGDDGKTYDIMVSRVTSYDIKIYYGGILEIHFGKITEFPEHQNLPGLSRFTITYTP